MAPVLGLERRMDDLESKLEMVRGGQLLTGLRKLGSTGSGATSNIVVWQSILDQPAKI